MACGSSNTIGRQDVSSHHRVCDVQKVARDEACFDGLGWDVGRQWQWGVSVLARRVCAVQDARCTRWRDGVTAKDGPKPRRRSNTTPVSNGPDKDKDTDMTMAIRDIITFHSSDKAEQGWIIDNSPKLTSTASPPPSLTFLIRQFCDASLNLSKFHSTSSILPTSSFLFFCCHKLSLFAGPKVPTSKEAFFKMLQRLPL